MKCLHLLFLCCCYSYSAALSTDPVSVNGETPVVSAVEDASNVTVFCAVNQTQTGTMMPFLQLGGSTSTVTNQFLLLESIL